MAVQNKVLYAFRGWIAFVAFMDLGTAGRSYIERRTFLNHHGDTEHLDGDFTISRMLGMYSVLKALALIHCTLYIHYRPVVSMGYWSLVLTIVLYFTEAFYYHSTNLNFYIVFPCILNIITLLGLIYLPTKLKLWGTVPGTSGMEREIEDENTQILRQMGTFKRRRPQHKNKTKYLASCLIRLFSGMFGYAGPVRRSNLAKFFIELVWNIFRLTRQAFCSSANLIEVVLWWFVHSAKRTQRSERSKDVTTARTTVKTTF